MSEQAKSGQLGQFLGDLSAIREKRNVSLEALRDATKVYPNIISQFEKDGLLNHPLFNSLYVRAFIRSYSSALEIPAEEVLKAYDEALKGNYDRQLAVEYLDLPAAELAAIEARLAEKEKTDQVFAADKFEFEQRGAEKAARSRPASQRMVKQTPARKSAGGKSKAKKKGSGKDKVAEAAASGAAITFIPKSSGREATPLESMAAGVKSTLASIFEKGKQSPLFQWGLLVSGIGLGLFAILQLLSYQSGPAEKDNRPFAGMNATQESTRAASLPDSMTSASIDAPARRVPVVLGDSIPFYIVAATGKLDPFRVKQDSDLRRPYWINEGDSMLFYFEDRVVIEDNLQAMKILIEGYSYPIYETDSLATVIIDRDSIQAFLATR